MVASLVFPNRYQPDQGTDQTGANGDEATDYFHPPFNSFTSFPFFFAYSKSF